MRRIRVWKVRSYAVLALGAFVLVAVLSATAATAATPVLGPIETVFVGHVRTMDALGTVAEAVAVDGRGLIVAVGTEAEVMATAEGADPEVIRFAPGETLLPGFIDAHMHVIGLISEHSGLVALLGACRPGPYAGDPEGCANTIGESFARLKEQVGDTTSDAFVVGINLDPSRQPYSRTEPSAAFKARPAEYIERDLTAGRPVLIIDQSGHFAYVNELAFDALMHEVAPDCDASRPSCAPAWPAELEQGAVWEVEEGCEPAHGADNSCYTGLLVEIPAYNPFFEAIGASVLADLEEDPERYVAGLRAGVESLLAAFRVAGLTTITSMAQSDGELAATRKLAELPTSGTRMLSVVPPKLAVESAHLGSAPLPAACDPHEDDCRLPRDLGVDGIKVISDGSTQGCTAALMPPSLYLAPEEGGDCSDAAGHLNFDDAADLAGQLADLWNRGTWRFEVHANGNRGLDTVLGALAIRQQAQANPHTATIIHATVGDETLWRKASRMRSGTLVADGRPVPALDLRFSHLIGHVAYWGQVFERQLGPEAAADIDPTAMDRYYGIPFSLHSDGPVSVPVPLWFVRQAVTRETWSYPDLADADVHVLGRDHRISVREALRAVTIRPAEEKELDRWLGSIEVGKVADFVVLAADPVAFDPATGGDPTEISEIAVIDTYLGGRVTGSAAGQPAAPVVADSQP